MTRCARAGPRGRVWAPRQSPASHSRPAIYLSVGKAGEPRRQGPPDREPRALGGGGRGRWAPRAASNVPNGGTRVQVGSVRAGVRVSTPSFGDGHQRLRRVWRSRRGGQGPCPEGLLVRRVQRPGPERSARQTARTPTLHLYPRGAEVMGELVLGRVGPRATRPASAERAHLAVTPCSLGGSGEARGGCGGSPAGAACCCTGDAVPRRGGGAGKPRWRGRWSRGVDSPSTASEPTARIPLRGEPGVGHYLGDPATSEPLRPNFRSDLVVPG